MTDQIKMTGRSISGHKTRPVVRVLRWYEKNGDRLVGETILDSLDLPELQKLFQESADNPMVDSYPIYVEQAARLQSKIEEPINLNAYDFYLECDAI
jgi:hypothetical protein